METYIKTNWAKGDLITAENMNKIEDYLVTLNEKINLLETTINNYETATAAMNVALQSAGIPFMGGIEAFATNEAPYDLNNVVAPGFYTYHYTDSSLHAPTNGGGALIVTSSESDKFVYQIAYPNIANLTSLNQFFIRCYRKQNENGVWTGEEGWTEWTNCAPDKINVTNITDLNAPTYNGVYHFTNAANNRPYNVSAGGFLLHLQGESGGYCTQVVSYSTASTSAMAPNLIIRTSSGDNTVNRIWTNWRTVTTTNTSSGNKFYYGQVGKSTDSNKTTTITFATNNYSSCVILLHGWQEYNRGIIFCSADDFTTHTVSYSSLFASANASQNPSITTNGGRTLQITNRQASIIQFTIIMINAPQEITIS